MILPAAHKVASRYKGYAYKFFKKMAFKIYLVIYFKHSKAKLTVSAFCCYNNAWGLFESLNHFRSFKSVI